ncbi:hypothetical protein [Rhodococcus sp. HNM0569]|uniref:hypothetical protein n=1 Tax=Rhodococcus sp. HNM0569 TaxID=2716340 RepID=UPI00146E6517|nr:hypothetical protein [Rhodococcus sp. HNM0569]NLU85048.1 hypothetical protein [Rhodococcus sp. HNM0569]
MPTQSFPSPAAPLGTSPAVPLGTATVRDTTILLLGNPELPHEVERWAHMRAWARANLVGVTRDADDASVVCAVAPESILDGLCSPAAARHMQLVHTRGLPCVSFDTPLERLAELCEGALRVPPLP